MWRFRYLDAIGEDKNTEVVAPATQIIINSDRFSAWYELSALNKELIVKSFY